MRQLVPQHTWGSGLTKPDGVHVGMQPLGIARVWLCLVLLENAASGAMNYLVLGLQSDLFSF